jgi:hypothetical protein
MICNKYSNLTPVDRVLFIGELTHACMGDDDLYEMGQALIDLARQKGLFDNVVIMPQVLDLAPEETNP